MVGDLTLPVPIAATTVASAAAGDIDALARIVGQYQDDMARVCYVICADPDLAQEAVQVAWPIAWRKMGTLRDPDRLRPWLMSIAANEARQLMRRQRRRIAVDLTTVDVASSGSDPGAHADLLDLEASLRRLSADERRLLALRYVAGFDATEIGQAIGVSPSGVRSRLARLVARLRSELQGD